MIFGMTLATYTLLHVVVSLIGIASGFVVMYGFVTAKRLAKQLDGWVVLFLTTTVLTSVTGFGFPVERFLPSHGVGILSLIALALAIAGRYAFHLMGAWRSIYVISSVVALYFNVFVAVVQSFEKIPALKALAPTQTEAPFVVAQVVVMVLFIWLGIVATKRSRSAALPAAIKPLSRSAGSGL